MVQVPVAAIVARCDTCRSEWCAIQMAIPSHGALCRHCGKGHIVRTGVQQVPMAEIDED